MIVVVFLRHSPQTCRHALRGPASHDGEVVEPDEAGATIHAANGRLTTPILIEDAASVGRSAVALRNAFGRLVACIIEEEGITLGRFPEQDIEGAKRRELSGLARFVTLESTQINNAAVEGVAGQLHAAASPFVLLRTSDFSEIFGAEEHLRGGEEPSQLPHHEEGLLRQRLGTWAQRHLIVACAIGNRRRYGLAWSLGRGTAVIDGRIGPTGPATGETPGRTRKIVLVVGGKHMRTEHDLFATTQVDGRQGLVFRLGQGRQQHSGENGDDGDDHQQLDEGEAVAQVALTAIKRCRRGVHAKRFVERQFMGLAVMKRSERRIVNAGVRCQTPVTRASVKTSYSYRRHRRSVPIIQS